MEQEYATSTGWKIFYGVGAIALVAFTFILFSVGKRGGPPNSVLIVFSILSVAGAVSIIINLYKRKVTLSDYSIRYTSIWGSKEMLTPDVRGFRVSEKVIYIEPEDKSKSKLTIRDYASIGNKAELIRWLGDKFKDLNKADYEAATEEILQDSTFGFTPEEREQNLKKARKYTMIYSLVSIGFFFFPLVLQITNKYLAIPLLIYPCIGIAMMAYGKGLIRLFAKKNSAYAAIFTGLLFPAFALLVQSLTNDKILDFNKVWPPVIITGLVILAILYVVAVKKAKGDMLLQLFFALIIAAVYAFGSVLEINSAFDTSEATLHPVMVIDHYISHGKSTSYHITIDEWRPDHSSENISVSKSFYDSTPIGSKVNVNLKKGALNIAWYYVTQ